ncbi:DNA-binding protein [Dysgonomonas sp. Marseille-P4361]|uniref:DNA-binding protein n=1 Tax=Dysgonomonas sp. Marseille-P4361 TaxID=2161820 RepID=UPI000D55BD57|nr:DNA-binding protein [Dysgonomonas sp. Marseille-P4361]
MTKVITFSELRRIKDSLPDGSVRLIAEKLQVPIETVWNYFGGYSYEKGQSCGVHIEPGPDGGYVSLDDTTILDMAMEMLEPKEV